MRGARFSHRGTHMLKPFITQAMQAVKPRPVERDSLDRAHAPSSFQRVLDAVRARKVPVSYTGYRARTVANG